MSGDGPPESALDQKGNLTAEGNKPKWALIWLHGTPAKLEHTYFLKVKKIIDFDLANPINHYRVNWVDENGEHSAPAAQVMVVAESQQKINEYLADGGRLKFSRKRVSGATQVIEKRLPPVFLDDDSQLLPEEEPPKSPLKSKEKTANDAALKAIKKPKKPKLQLSDDEDYANSKMSTMNDLDLEDNKPTEMNYLRKDLENADAKCSDLEAEVASMNKIISDMAREKKILYGKIQSLQSELGEKNAHVESLKIRLKEVEESCKCAAETAFPENYETSASTAQRQMTNNDLSDSVSVPTIPDNSRNVTCNLPFGHFTKDVIEALQDMETRARGKVFQEVDPSTGEKVEKIHLRYDCNVVKDSWETTLLNPNPNKVLPLMMYGIWGSRRVLGYRAVSAKNTTSEVEPGVKRLPMTPNKVACLKKEYFKYLNENVEDEDVRNKYKREFGYRVGYHVNNAHAAAKNAVVSEKVTLKDSYMSPEKNLSTPLSSRKKLHARKRVHQSSINLSTPLSSRRERALARSKEQLRQFQRASPQLPELGAPDCELPMTPKTTQSADSGKESEKESPSLLEVRRPRKLSKK